MDNGEKVELLSVAIDMQGSQVVKPYLEEAKTTFVTVVDEENKFSREFGFKRIPNGYFIEPDLTVTYSKTGGFDIRSPEILKKTQKWVRMSGDSEGQFVSPIVEEINAEAEPFMNSGLNLYQEGKKEEAIVEWRQAVNLDPENLTIRKQIWAIMNPDKFYDGEIDFHWQSRQFSAEGVDGK